MSWMDELRRLLRQVGRRAPSEDSSEGIHCTEAVERVFEWLDGEMDPQERRRVGKHLEACARCYPVLVFEKSFHEALLRAPKGASPPKELRRKVMDSLESAGFKGD